MGGPQESSFVVSPQLLFHFWLEMYAICGLDAVSSHNNRNDNFSMCTITLINIQQSGAHANVASTRIKVQIINTFNNLHPQCEMINCDKTPKIHRPTTVLH
jgi:hypothetical protein